MARILAALSNPAIGAGFIRVFHLHHWKCRDCIEAARTGCLAPESDNRTRGGMIRAVPAVGFLLIDVALPVAVWHARRRSHVHPASRNDGGRPR